jgi:molybdopterin-containing oxidoreductase family membrane subunit
MPETPQLVERPQDDIAPGYTFDSVTDQIAAVVLTKRTPIFWFLCFGVGFGLLLLLLLATAILFAKGTGIWGIRAPVMWGFAITNFVWWI